MCCVCVYSIRPSIHLQIMPGEPVCRRERRAGESVVDSGYMEAGGRWCGQPAGGGALSPGPRGTVYHQSGPLERIKKHNCQWWGFCFCNNIASVFPCIQAIGQLGSPLNYNWPVEKLYFSCFIYYLFICLSTIIKEKHQTSLNIIQATLFRYPEPTLSSPMSHLWVTLHLY